MTRHVARALLLVGAAALACCKSPHPSSGAVRVGFFPNVTHAAALVAKKRDAFARVSVPVEMRVFNAGPEAMEALFAGAIDACYVGPLPAMNAYLRSGGEAVVIVAGAASGGAALVVRADAGITGPESLHGKKLATPQLGNTQDVALRIYLREHGLRAREAGGDVQVMPIANPDIFTLFRTARLDGAWVPEPWVSRLELEAGAKVLVDERDLWPNHRFPVAVLVVTRKLARERPDVVRELVAAHVATVDWIDAHRGEAEKLVGEALFEVAHKKLPPGVLERAFSRVEITSDPMPDAIVKLTQDGRALDYLPREGDPRAAIDLRFLDGEAHD